MAALQRQTDTDDGLHPLRSWQEGKPETDTADIIMLRRDTLVLKYKDHEQGYYRKTENN